MSEEEKKAIENLKKELNQYEYTKDLDLASDNYFGQFEEKINIVTIILNLIEKQQKEIQNLQNIDKEHQKLNGELREEIQRQGNAREIEEKYIEKNFISKDKIREKIKEYDKIRLETKDSDLYDEMQDYIDVLIELLKEE